MESRRAWKHVAEAIHAGDIFAVGTEKGKIENEQRELRKREKAEGREYQRRFFRRVGEDVVAEELVKGVKAGGLESMMGGREVWAWDEEGWRKWEEKTKGRKCDVGSRVKSPMRMRFDSGVGGILLDLDVNA